MWLTQFIRIVVHVLASQSLAICAKPNGVYIHTFMKNSYNQDFLATCLFVEYYVTTLRKFSVPISYFVAAFADIRIFGQQPK